MNTAWSLVATCVLAVFLMPWNSRSDTPPEVYIAPPAPAAWYLERIGAPAEHLQPVTPVIVAVIDAGVDTSAPLLLGRIADTVNIVAPDSLHDQSGHGTHTAGIIAAQADASGIRGICRSCRLLILKAITNDGYGSDLTVARAITIAIERGAIVINLSIGGPSDTPAIRNAIADAIAHDIVVVAAAGNTSGEGQQRSYPAAYPGVIAVSATDQSNHLAAFARADASIDLVAPGGRHFQHRHECYRHGERQWDKYVSATGECGCSTVAGCVSRGNCCRGSIRTVPFGDRPRPTRS